MDTIYRGFQTLVYSSLALSSLNKEVLEKRICVSKTIDWTVAKSACITRFPYFRLTRAAVCFYSRKTARPAAIHALAVGPAHAHRVAGRPLCTLPAGYFFYLKISFSLYYSRAYSPRTHKYTHARILCTHKIIVRRCTVAAAACTRTHRPKLLVVREGAASVRRCMSISQHARRSSFAGHRCRIRRVVHTRASKHHDTHLCIE